MFAIENQPIDVKTLKNQQENSRAGALVTFEGWVRNHNDGRTVLRLEYEAYEALANSEGKKVLDETKERFNVLDVVCVHRVGTLEIGDLAVWIGVTAEHRGEAFKACQNVINEIKTRLPIWKKEHYKNGDSGWVNCEECSKHAKAQNQ